MASVERYARYGVWRPELQMYQVNRSNNTETANSITTNDIIKLNVNVSQAGVAQNERLHFEAAFAAHVRLPRPPQGNGLEG